MIIIGAAAGVNNNYAHLLLCVFLQAAPHQQARAPETYKHYPFR